MSDELAACWAALVAFVEDVHAPQDQLTEAQWRAAEQEFGELGDLIQLGDRDQVMFNALGTMLDAFDVPDMEPAAWALAEQMLAEYTAKVEGEK